MTESIFWFREKKIKEKQNQQETQNPDLSLQTSWLTQINVNGLQMLFIFNKKAPLIHLSSWASVHKHLGIKLVSKLLN